MAAPDVTAADQLATFVPRLTIEWLRTSPELRWLEVDGTLAFIDISGFTAMSEQLSSRGRAGAEEVTDVMNATFSALLDVAYAEGGGLLKFGGDALLLLFDGEGHAARAARAAFNMRSRLRAVGRPRTSVGTVTLKMHAGLNSGRFQFFLVGTSHRELLITGPAATRTVEMEAASEAGEIHVSPETAAFLDPATLGEEKGPGTLLQAAPSVTSSAAPPPEIPPISLEQAVPAPLRSQLLEVGPLEGEHRHAAIAFVRFSGVDEIISTEGPAAAAEAISALVEALQTAAAEHDVTFLESDVDRDGGRIILVSGAPQTFGDDEERLLRTVRTAVDSGLPLPVHIGVSQGRVFAGQVGAPFRRTYTVLGDTAALAARLMARAGEDEIWVSRDAYERGGMRFESTELEPLTLKGKAEPVHAVMLGTPAAAPTTAFAGESTEQKLPFVDRERERAVLGAAVAPVRMGFGTLVELIGEPGIGKSRLAEELESNCADMAKINARCDQYEATTPYFPFRPLLRSLLDIELNGGGEHNRTAIAERLATVDQDLVPWAPLLGAPLDVEVASTPEVDDLDPAFWRARLHGVMGRLLGGLLPSPTLMLFEDVHWMDDASSELLRFLGAQLPTKPWLACTTRRPIDGGFAAAEGTPPLPALTLRLEPIPEEDAKTLARAAAGDRALTDEELAALMERAAGNPLFLQELAATDAVGDATEEMPETVEAVVAARIDRLAPGDRALLRWASVLGVSFSGAVIVDVLEGDPNVAAASEAWERLGEFVEFDPDIPGHFRFRHALIRDAAYEGLSYKRRRELHARVAEVLEERQSEPEPLSLHFLRAERWPEAWRYSIEAGRRAWAKYANVEAAQFFERGLDLVKRVPSAQIEEIADVWEILGDARMRLADYERAGDAYKAARNLAADEPVEQARLMQKAAIAPLRLGRYAQALGRLNRAFRSIADIEGTEAEAQRARIAGWYAGVLQYQRQFEKSLEWCRRAIDEGERSGAEDAAARGYFALDWGLVALGRREEAVYSARAIEIYEQLGDLERLAWVLNNLGGFTYLDGQWDEALDLAERARATFARMGDDANASVAALNIAEVRSDQGRMEEADPVFRSVLEVRRAAGNPLKIAEGASLLGRHEARVGSFDEAHALLEEARELYAAEDDAAELVTTDVRRAECLALEGRGADSLALVAEIRERAKQLTGLAPVVANLHRVRGWASMQTGDLDAAEEALTASLHVAEHESENFGFRSVDYEVALTLSAVVRLHELKDMPADEERERRDAIFAKLGVVEIAEPPL